MRLDIPTNIEEVLNIINDNNYQAFIVGGSVRDLLLNKDPSDYDITTNARPEAIEEIFKDYRTVDIGKEFGTIVVVYEGENIEITSYRTESDYIDGRKPRKVAYASDIREDLSRRDFTINAMAYNHREGLVDLYNGRKDLEDKIIRTVGDPNERFTEDYLRIMRAVRFSSQLDFKIEEETFKACKKHGSLLENISKERIREELFKIILSPAPSKGIRLMEDLGILKIILPDLEACIGFDQKNPHHNKDVYDHSLCVLDGIKPDLAIRLGGLFHDIGKPRTFVIGDDGIGHFYGHEKVGAEMTEEILRSYNCSNKLIDKVVMLVREHMGHNGRLSDKGIRRLLYRLGEDNLFDLLELQKSDMRCSLDEEGTPMLDQREEDIKRILAEKEYIEENKLEIDGNDIIGLGFSQGRRIGEIIDYLTDLVLEEPGLNNKEDLIRIVREKFLN